jgi:hypothetical protein
MDSPRYRNVILTVIASLLAVIAFGEVTTNRVTTLVPAAHAAQPSGDLAVLAVGNEGVVTRLLVWDKAAGAIYEYDTKGKVRNTWIIKGAGQPLEKR